MKKNIGFYALFSLTFLTSSLFSAANTASRADLEKEKEMLLNRVAEIENILNPAAVKAGSSIKPVAIKPQLAEDHPLRNLPKIKKP